MIVERIITGQLEENCYILKNAKTKECLVVDPGNDFEKIKKGIGDFQVLKVLLTHDHFDHVGALKEVEKEYSIETLKRSNASEKEYVIGPFKFKVIFTPGHSSDSITFYFVKEKKMFVGDFLFQGTIGRTDLPTGSLGDMINSLYLIKKYPEDITIYSGHGEVSTLQEEFENNPYLLNLKNR